MDFLLVMLVVVSFGMSCYQLGLKHSASEQKDCKTDNKFG